MKLTKVILAACFVATAMAATKNEWKSQVIYQMLTDRFARTDGSTSPCGDLTQYCGGTYQGAVAKLDYIRELGPTAVWISPIPRQIDDLHSFHGYWAAALKPAGDDSGLNRHFGSSSDLRAFVGGLHSRNMFAMLDVVANHMGGTIGDIGGFYPFNQSYQYHGCQPCPSDCNINFNDNDQQQVELCRLSGLPDLNQSVPFVATALQQWVSSQVQGYGFDGLRVDTVPEVAMPFWRAFQQAAGTYAVGEVFNGDLGYVGPYQAPSIGATSGALTGLLSYPLFFTIRNVFASQQSMYQLQTTLKAMQGAFVDLDVLGTFVDNHDNPRFLHLRNDHTAFKAALAFSITTRGIPIVYYGSEQGLSGTGQDGDASYRQPLWPTGYDTSNDLYTFLQTVISVRQNNSLWTLDQTQRYADDTFYAFSRGQILVALTNVGSNGPQQVRTITYGVGDTWPIGCVLENVFYPGADRVTVQSSGFKIYLDSGETKVYLPLQGC